MCGQLLNADGVLVKKSGHILNGVLDNKVQCEIKLDIFCGVLVSRVLGEIRLDNL